MRGEQKEQQPASDSQTRRTDAVTKRDVSRSPTLRWRLIATEEIASLTVAALANELGLTGGALYRHFRRATPSLDAVAERVVELLDVSTRSPAVSHGWLEQFVDSRTRAVSGHKGLG